MTAAKKRKLLWTLLGLIAASGQYLFTQQAQRSVAPDVAGQVAAATAMVIDQRLRAVKIEMRREHARDYVSKREFLAMTGKLSRKMDLTNEQLSEIRSAINALSPGVFTLHPTRVFASPVMLQAKR